MGVLISTDHIVLLDLQLKPEVAKLSRMKPSRIPPHMELFKKTDKQQQSIDALPSMLKKRMNLPKDFEFLSIDPQAILSDDLATPKKKETLSEWPIRMKHIINAIEEQTHETLPEIRNEDHVTDLFNVGYKELKLKPNKRKRRITRIQHTTALRLISGAEDSGTRSFPFNPRKHQTAV
ncbi:hypothetical protein PHMEG_00023910 [Phytophthora megakarya]|uniref:Uncharacterized protein n=1 Tax=Phytophthora megakarya TaxID=4795 RepID=A0A225VFY4_9STRA|nr:hypothetical protein PHMEG_00023910 [Phytophthora megakarya]